MTVKIRPYRNGGLEVDIRITLADGSPYRERKKAPVSTKSLALRWGTDREKHLIIHGIKDPKPAAPTLAAFVPQFLANARANREKASTIVGKQSILDNHLLPAVGTLPLDRVGPAEIAALKAALVDRAIKTVNNVLTCWNAVYTAAIALGLITTRPVIALLPSRKRKGHPFHGLEEYQRLVDAAAQDSSLALVVVLLGGDQGLRAGEIIALEWDDLALLARRMTINRADWHGVVDSPKGGQGRVIPLTQRTVLALQAHRHLAGPRVGYQTDGGALTQMVLYGIVRRVARKAGLTLFGVHTLRHTFCSHLAMKGVPARAIQELAGHEDLSTTLGYMHLSPRSTEDAIRALEGDHKEMGDTLGRKSSTH